MQSSLAAAIALLLVATSWRWVAARGRHPSLEIGADVAYGNFLATRHFAGLDGLRALSVIAVVWFHVAGPQAVHLLNQGNSGVDMFFGISGFLVTSLLIRESRSFGVVSLKNFYIRRALRIFPLYYAVLSLYCVLVFVTFRGTTKASEFWDNFPAFASYTSNWFVSAERGHEHGVTFYFAWSLATEEQFYLFWPPLMVLLLKRTRKYSVAAMAALALVAVQSLAASYGSGLAGTILASLAPSILFGATLALLLHDRAWFRRLHPVLGHPAAAPLLLSAFLLALQLDAPGLLARLLMAMLVAALCIRRGTLLHPVLCFRPLELVGVMSYGIYLLHMLCANLARTVLGQHEGLAVFCLTLVAAVGMAAASYRFFELPVLRLKRRFATPEQQGVPAAPTPTGMA